MVFVQPLQLKAPAQTMAVARQRQKRRRVIIDSSFVGESGCCGTAELGLGCRHFRVIATRWKALRVRSPVGAGPYRVGELAGVDGSELVRESLPGDRAIPGGPQR